MSRNANLVFGEQQLSSSKSIPKAGHRISEQADLEMDGRWAEEEALRLVQHIFLLQAKEPPKVVIFAGVDHGNGCTQVCASVARALAANAERPVCLVQASFHTSSAAGSYGTGNYQGPKEVHREKGSIGSFAIPVQQENLWLLSSGALATDSSDLLTSEHLSDKLGELSQDFKFVIIDAPPLTRYSDAIVLGQHSDGLVLVLEANKTRREAASAVAAKLRNAGVPILAAVLNKRTFPIPASVYKRL